MNFFFFVIPGARLSAYTIPILGHVGGRQEGGRKWAGRGDSDFSSGGGGGRVLQKLQKQSYKFTFRGSFGNWLKICNFAVFKHIFFILLAVLKKNLLTKGGIFFQDKGESIKCSAGGGIRTLPFRRRRVTVPFPPPPMPTYDHPTWPLSGRQR